MLNSLGQKRRFKHNVQLAAVLSLVAGLVNIGGLLSFNVFTTNITGHFANFADELVGGSYVLAGSFLVFLLAFLLGSFTSAISLELLGNKRPILAHTLPLIVEIGILFGVGIRRMPWGVPNDMMMALLLLFAMGLQNALVTKVSNAVVRTTHFTGIFTDLGIDLAQIITQSKLKNLQIVKLNVFLRVIIILFFFLGCVAGGFIFQSIGNGIFVVTASILTLVILIEQITSQFFFKRLTKAE